MKQCKECHNLIDTFCPTCENTPPIRTALDLYEYEMNPEEAISRFEADTIPY